MKQILIGSDLCLWLLTWMVLTMPDRSPAAEVVDLTKRRAVADFIRLPAGWSLGPCSAVSVNRQGEIFLFHRGEHPIIVCDAQGKYLRSWGDGLIGSAHALRIDGNDDIWVTDIGNHRVFKFDSEGKLLLSLGTGKPGNGTDEFNKPTDLAFGPKGEIYVTDGYGNARVLVFSPSGALLHTWGKPGRGEGEFRIPHSIVIDRQGRLLVGDRENDRIQMFDADGKLLDVWNGFAPYGLAFDSHGTLFVADGRANQVLQLDAAGRVVERFGREGTAVGEFTLPHMLAFDTDDNLLITEIGGKRVQKLVRE
jgi:DNA-binding beta-propeller fold protein YncE